MVIVKDEKGVIRERLVEQSDQLRWGWVTESGFMLPHHPDFNTILQNSPSSSFRSDLKEGKVSNVLVVDSASGLLRAGSPKQVDEYLYGGEYECRLSQIGELPN